MSPDISLVLGGHRRRSNHLVLDAPIDLNPYAFYFKWMKVRFFLFIAMVIAVSSCVTNSPERKPASEICTNECKILQKSNANLKLGEIGTIILFPDSEIEKRWREVLKVAVKRFPELEFTPPEDLHLTVIYVGDWSLDKLESIVKLASVKPFPSMSLKPTFKRFGEKLLVLSVPANPKWIADVEAARLELNARKLRNAGQWDYPFDPHLSLAWTRGEKPTPAQIQKLNEFERWLSATGFLNQVILLGPNSHFRVIVTDSSKPSNAPTYFPIEDYLRYEVSRLPKVQ